MEMLLLQNASNVLLFYKMSMRLKAGSMLYFHLPVSCAGNLYFRNGKLPAREYKAE
jgi:hypothetical protein